ncbi:MAG: hypothetical protein LBP80_03345 [Treponema sp.]|jgi:hypothetical protein|nr:hypothetical protein [Treponema sp.]
MGSLNFRIASFAVFFLLSCLCAGCSRPQAAPEAVPQAETESPGPEYPAPDKLFAVVKAGDDPVWFELGPEGPVHIPSPEAAVPIPYQPWTAARFIAGMNPGPGRLAMAVNRYGFLLWTPQNGEAALYRLPEPAWDSLTVAALFRYAPGNGSGAWDAALLYRDDVFSGAADGSPEERVRALPPGGFAAEALDIPAFSPLPGNEGWDLESLRQGRDGVWYFRGVRGGANPASVYYRAAKLAFAGDSVASGVFRNAVSPYNYEEAPPVLRRALEEAAVLEGGKTLIAAIISPVFDAPRYFAAGRTGGGELSSFTELSGFYLPAVSPAEFPGADAARTPSAALLFPDGRLVYAAEDEAIRAALPGLPEGFVYTRLGAAGTTLIAAWEEQLEWNIGAAGFMVIKERVFQLGVNPGGRR